MKSKFFNLLVACCTLIVLIFSCKKNDKLVIESKHLLASIPAVPSSLARFQDSVTITSYGHLKFASADNLIDYMLFVKSHTHRQVFAYLDSIGFVSLASTKYSGAILNDSVTERQAIDYALDTNNIVQVENAVIRPIIETESGDLSHEFILVVREDYLDSTSYQYLITGTYNSEIMDQFATFPYDDPEDYESDDLLEIINKSPFGIQETVANSWPASWDHPIFGYGSIPDGANCEEWQETDAGCDCLMWRHKLIIKGKKYFFGIKVKDYKYNIEYGRCP